MRNICFVYRKPRIEYFSIENVFSTVQKQVTKKGAYIIYDTYVPYSQLTIKNVWKNLRFVSKKSADIYHVTGDVHYLTLGLPASKTILTIHDCGFISEAKGLKRWMLQNIFLKWPAHHCRLITTISERTRKDIIAYTGCSPDKIVIIPNPVDEHFYYSKKDFDKIRPVLLFVGIAPHKNLPRVIEAARGITCLIDIVGKIPEDDRRMLKLYGIDFRESINISRAELALKYAEADMVLFPTLFEGFGLPIIEAQKSGRPVITSNLSPMKEVAGEGAYLVDPYSVADIRAAILSVIEEDEQRRHVVEMGFQNCQRYLPEAIADQYCQQYDRIK